MTKDTKCIEMALGYYADDRLAQLQRAAEKGELEYYNTCGCLVHYQQGDYRGTKEHHPAGLLWFMAEIEFYFLADIRKIGSEQARDLQRCEGMLPLIHAEWERRARPVPVTFEQPVKVEVPVAASRQS